MVLIYLWILLCISRKIYYNHFLNTWDIIIFYVNFIDILCLIYVYYNFSSFQKIKKLFSYKDTMYFLKNKKILK